MNTNETETATATATAKKSVKKSVKKSATDKPFISINNGASATEFTSTIKTAINTQYPGLLETIEKSGFINGAKFYKIYFRHTAKTENGKTAEFFINTKTIIPPKYVTESKPAPRNGRTIINTLPKNHPFHTILTPFTDTVFILTITYHGNDYRTIHYNSTH
jgi:hypothetical protein